MPRNGRTKDPAVEVTGPRSLTRLLGLFDVLAKSTKRFSDSYRTMRLMPSLINFVLKLIKTPKR